MRPRSPWPVAALALAVALAISACGSSDGSSSSGSSGDGAQEAITVTATDSTCDVSRTTAPAGTVEFTVTNDGTKVNEFYVYAEGDRIVGEVENIGPGLTRSLHVELSEPGTYETACKPGMVGDGIRAPFTVT